MKDQREFIVENVSTEGIETRENNSELIESNLSQIQPLRKKKKSWFIGWRE